MRWNTVLICTLFLLVSSTARSDVIKLNDGRIILGKILNVEHNSIYLESFGAKRSIPNSEILKTEPDVAGIKNTPMEIQLKGGSMLNGMIQNYDEEMGVLLNIGFGNLTVPVGSIEEIRDPAATKKYSGYAVKTGVNIAPYFVLGDLSDSYDTSVMGAVYGEFRVPKARGLAIGLDFAYRYVRYTEDDMRYAIMSLKPYLMYSFFDFHKLASWTGRITPFVQLYGGPAYISLRDDRDYIIASKKSELDLELALAAGFDINVAGDIALRLSPAYAVIFQKNSSFHNIALFLGANYGF
jgi:hypothetical protein